jgi:hypothetical protein
MRRAHLLFQEEDSEAGEDGDWAIEQMASKVDAILPGLGLETHRRSNVYLEDGRLGTMFGALNGLDGWYIRVDQGAALWACYRPLFTMDSGQWTAAGVHSQVPPWQSMLSMPSRLLLLHEQPAQYEGWLTIPCRMGGSVCAWMIRQEEIWACIYRSA